MNIESPVDEKKLHKFYENISKSVNQKIEDWLEHYGDLSFSKRIEFERLLNVSNEIRQILGEPSINIAETIKSHVLTEGANGYNSVYYSLETGYNLDLNFHSLDNKFLTELMNSPVAGSTLSKRLYKYRDELASKISDAIARGFSFGYGYDRMALEISTITEANYRQALRIARTEGGRVRSITTQKGYEEVKEKGVDLKKQWMATNDGRTRTDHSLLNGQIQEVDEDFKIGSYKAQGPRMFGIAEEDINCRCTTVTVVNGIAPKLNREGENFYQKSYDDWLKEQGKKNSDETDDSLGKVYNEYTDIKSIKKYIDSIDISTASHEDLISLGSLVNSKFDVASKLGDKQALKDIFSNFREIGGTVPKDGWEKGSSKETKTRLNDTFAFYPKEWAEYAHQNGKTIFTKKLDRGFFSEAGLKGRSWKSGVVDNGVSIMLSDNATVSFHEIGHYVEYFNPNAIRLSNEFLAYRTKGEEEQPIRNTIYYYNVRERTKKDNFITPYIGKAYSNATEVFSTGLECLFEPGNGKVFSHESRISEVVMKKISDDPEYLNFVIGMILKG